MGSQVTGEVHDAGQRVGPAVAVPVARPPHGVRPGACLALQCRSQRAPLLFVDLLAAPAGGIVGVVPRVFAQHPAAQRLTPCRIVDTRNPTGPLGEPTLAGQADRIFALRGVCAVPATAKALAANLTVTEATQGEHLSLHPPGLASKTSAINFTQGGTRANNAVLVLDADSRVGVLSGQPAGSVHFILDVNGYFE